MADLNVPFQKLNGSKKSPTGPSEWTPKPEYLIALAACTLPRGPLVRSCLIFDGMDIPLGASFEAINFLLSNASC